MIIGCTCRPPTLVTDTWPCKNHKMLIVDVVQPHQHQHHHHHHCHHQHQHQHHHTRTWTAPEQMACFSICDRRMDSPQDPPTASWKFLKWNSWIFCTFFILKTRWINCELKNLCPRRLVKPCHGLVGWSENSDSACSQTIIIIIFFMFVIVNTIIISIIIIMTNFSRLPCYVFFLCMLT